MKFFVSIIAIALLAFIAGNYLPWWTIAVVGFIITLLLPQKPFLSFITGFIAIFLLWAIMAALINTANAGILAGRISKLFGIGNNPAAMVIITGCIGGLITGLASLTASYLRQPVKK